MQFTQIPKQHAPSGGELWYAFEAFDAGAEQTTAVVTLTEPLCGVRLGAKRFVGVAAARFDIAPYVRRTVRFRPVAGTTGVYAPDGRVVRVIAQVCGEAGAPAPAGRIAGTATGHVGEAPEVEAQEIEVREVEVQEVEVRKIEVPEVEVRKIEVRKIEVPEVEVQQIEALEVEVPEIEAREIEAPEVEVQQIEVPEVEAREIEASEDMAVAEERTFLPGLFDVPGPAILTEMPRKRLIGTDEADELTLLTDAAGGEVAVTAVQGGGKTVVKRYALPPEGLHLFRLDMRDFPGAESVTVDAGACGAVEYTVVRVPSGARRVAWRSRAGSLEHYTFPTEVSMVVGAAKKRAYGAGGYVAAATEQWSMTLGSAYEGPKVLEALSGLLSSPQVWLADRSYRPVEVLTEKTTVSRNGVMSAMELVIRPVRKTRLPWS